MYDSLEGLVEPLLDPVLTSHPVDLDLRSHPVTLPVSHPLPQSRSSRRRAVKRALLSDFTVGGAISKTNASGNAFRDFVYFGFMEVED